MLQPYLPILNLLVIFFQLLFLERDGEVIFAVSLLFPWFKLPAKHVKIAKIMYKTQSRL